MISLNENSVVIYLPLKNIRDGAKFMGYPGRVLGKYRFEKKFWPPFFIMKKSLGPSYFYVKKVLAPRFFSRKKVLARHIFSRKKLLPYPFFKGKRHFQSFFSKKSHSPSIFHVISFSWKQIKYKNPVTSF